MQITTLLQAFLHDTWLIDPQYAESQFPLILSIIQGKTEKPEKPPIPLSYLSLEMAADGSHEFSADKPSAENIMHMSIRGPITKYGGMCNYGTMDYISFLKAANADENVSGIMVSIDSPGGQGSGIELLRSALQESKKPTQVQIIGLAASAAAYSMVGAPKIYASSEVDMIGSFGGMVSWQDFSKAMEKAGVDRKTIYAPQSTEKNLESREAEKGNYKPIEESLKYMIDFHHQAVRDLRSPKSNAWEKGKMFFANEALEMGLIDGIQSMDESVESLVSLIQTNNKFSPMFNKHKKLYALAGIAEADLTEAQVEEVNAELDSLQVQAVRVVPASFVADADKAIAEKNLATAAQAKAEKERDEWKLKAETFGKQPGETPTQVEKKDETITTSNEVKAISQTDRELMELQGKTFIQVS